ncbi:cell division protein FtsZ [Mycoplasma sp. 128]|uniref:cell division protein FtsZ n=1 Tax=Mycoplasma sp. 3341 TaxID=3447506 RepID=UPI003F65A592
MDQKELSAIAKIKVIGVGGAGNNSIKSLIDVVKIEGVEYIAVNTDKQALKDIADQSICLQIGHASGRGAGANPEVGRQAAIDSKEEIRERIKNAELVIIAAGMGGGTGTGASPEIAKLAKESGALTLAVVTTPFGFEGTKRRQTADKGLEELRKNVDGYVVVSNEKLLEEYGNIPIDESWKYSNRVLKQLIRSIIDITVLPSYINLDFEDLNTLIRSNPGEFVVGIGQATGTDKAQKAVAAALKSPILESSILGATECIVQISIGKKGTLNDVNNVNETMKEIIGSDVNMIFGYNSQSQSDKETDDSIIVTIIAAGVENKKQSSHEISEEINERIKSSNIQFESDKTREIILSKDSHSMLNEFNKIEDEHSFENELSDVFGE